ncbi:glycosyltransferase [Acinetobacter junii]|uniref:glycosyltransferase n=3 Tax=Acinetobacter junii TaxID=40215 RepID=UPI002449EE90|nr:glycosyltransferase [Acinetobacter junii]MDH0718590.1 glycosyltransferase [Acinetobacter junii]
MIYLFYPSRILGGAELLILRTASLLKNSGFDVAIIDIENGWISNQVKTQKKDISLKYIYNEKIKLEDDSILITTANFKFKLDDFFEESSAKVIFWVVQPYNIITTLPKMPLKKRNKFDVLYLVNKTYMNLVENKYRAVILDIINKNGIVAMDGQCNDILKEYYSLSYQEYLPVFVEDLNLRMSIEKKNTRPIRAVWVGRIDKEFKIHILKKVIFDLKSYIQSGSVELNIIGDGEGLNELICFCKKIAVYEKIVFLGTLNREDLERHIKYMDIGFAMGTSAIDIASFKVPTILLDFSYSKVIDYKYRWFFEAENFDLGRDICFLKDINNMRAIEQIFQELNCDKDNIGMKSYFHVINNHGEEQIVVKLKKYFNQVNFSMCDIYNYRNKKPFWLKLRNSLYVENKK